jgi:hypothetical protein
MDQEKIVTEKQLRELESRIGAAEQAAEAAIRSFHELLTEVRNLRTSLPAPSNGNYVPLHSGSPTGDAPADVTLAVSSDPQRKRILGEPEFARVPAYAWIRPTPDRLLIGLFLLFIALPLIAFKFGWESGESLNENRNLAAPPEFHMNSVETLPSEIDAYFKDYFGFRKRLIRWDNIVLHKWLRISGDDAVIGKQGWLFYARQGVIKNFMGLTPLSPLQLQRWKTWLEARTQFAASRHAKYLFVIAPDKPSIYPEMLPDGIGKHPGITMYDQVVAYLRETKSPVEVLDLRPVLLQAKSAGLVYFPQDTHWNGRGYFAVYEEMCRTLQKWFPNIGPPQRLGTDYAIRRADWGGDWNLFGLPEEDLKYQSDLLFPLGTQRMQRVPVPLPAGIPPAVQPWDAIMAYNRPGKTGTVLLLHDSFMVTGAIDRYHEPLAEHFGRFVLIGGKPSFNELAALVNQEHPDLIIEESVERDLVYPPGVDVVVAAPAPEQPGTLPSLVVPTACAGNVNRILGAGISTIPPGSNVRMTANSTGLEMDALNDDPILMLPSSDKPVDQIVVKLLSPKECTLELYEISADNPKWDSTQLRVPLKRGLNELVLRPRSKTAQYRLDPGDVSGHYTIREVTYMTGCK